MKVAMPNAACIVAACSLPSLATPPTTPHRATSLRLVQSICQLTGSVTEALYSSTVLALTA